MDPQQGSEESDRMAEEERQKTAQQEIAAATEMKEIEGVNNGTIAVGGGDIVEKDGQLNGGIGREPVMSTKQVMKNVLVISLVFFLNFTAYGGLSKLQSSLHREEGMGVICQAVVYGTMCLSCLLLPKLAITYMGHKWCMTISLLGYILWMAANGYAVWGTMITASIILGICAATLWTPQCAYFTIVAKEYALQTGESEDGVLTRFFGIFFCFFQLCEYKVITAEEGACAHDNPDSRNQEVHPNNTYLKKIARR